MQRRSPILRYLRHASCTQGPHRHPVLCQSWLTTSQPTSRWPLPRSRVPEIIGELPLAVASCFGIDAGPGDRSGRVDWNHGPPGPEFGCLPSTQFAPVYYQSLSNPRRRQKRPWTVLDEPGCYQGCYQNARWISTSSIGPDSLSRRRKYGRFDSIRQLFPQLGNIRPDHVADHLRIEMETLNVRLPRALPYADLRVTGTYGWSLSARPWKLS
jgi:hypothetical protein